MSQLRSQLLLVGCLFLTIALMRLGSIITTATQRAHASFQASSLSPITDSPLATATEATVTEATPIITDLAATSTSNLASPLAAATVSPTTQPPQPFTFPTLKTGPSTLFAGGSVLLGVLLVLGFVIWRQR